MAEHDQGIVQGSDVRLEIAGYNTISVDDLIRFLRGEKTLPPKSFLLTFDDGRKDSYVGADPILEAVGFKAVMYVATADSITSVYGGRPIGYYLHEDDLRKMAASGRWEFGSHAVQASTTGGFIAIDKDGNKGNFLSNKKWLAETEAYETDSQYENRVRFELLDSRQRLEDLTGQKIESIAYPFGDYGQQTKNYPPAQTIIKGALKDYYEIGFQQVWPYDSEYMLNYPGEDMYHVRRIEPGPERTGEQLVKYIMDAETKQLPFNEDLSAMNGWRTLWGKSSLVDNILNIRSSTTTTGSSIFLDGSGLWKDYFYSIHLNWISGSNVTLISRYSNDGNYLSCTFNVKTVRINRKLDGVTETLTSVYNIADLPMPDVHLGMSVSGNVIRCYEGSRVVAFFYSDSRSPNHGGIGIQVWDREIGKASISVSAISAVEGLDSGQLKAVLPEYVVKDVPKSVTRSSTIHGEGILSSQIADGKKSVVDTSKVEMEIISASSLNSWKAALGGILFSSDGFVTFSPPYVTTAFVYAPGGYDWSDYRFDVSVGKAFGSKISVIGRYADSKNYVVCEYSDRDRLAILVNVKNGKRYLMNIGTIAGLVNASTTPSNNNLGIYAQGQSVSCLENGIIVAVSDRQDFPSKGTVGLKIFASSPGFARMEINAASVRPIVKI